MSRWLPVLMLAAAAGCATTADLPDSVAQRTLWLDNGALRVGVCPELGRIVWFGPSQSQQNLLWLNETEGLFADQVNHGWANWGGDKVWPAPQSDWAQVMGHRWPPDPVIDGWPWSLQQHDPLECVIQSQPSPYWGVTIQRYITLHPREPLLEIRNRVTRVTANDWPVHAWSVTQAKRPRYLLLGLEADDADDASDQAQWLWLMGTDTPVPAGIVHVLDRAVHLDPPTQPSSKIGVMGSWIAAIYQDWIFLQETDAVGPSDSYADHASTQTYAGGDYVELELLSPIRALPLNQSLEHVVRWRLIDLDRGSSGQTDSVLRRIRDHLDSPSAWR
jgi:hypothetical protein